MFLAVMVSKYGTDYSFESTLKKAQKKCDEHAKEIDKKNTVDRNSYFLGPYDSWCIYEIETKTVGNPESDLIGYLNKLFNLIHVNPHLLKTVESREE